MGTYDELIVNNTNLARKIAWDYYKKIGKYVDYDELYSIALLGLTKSAKTFDNTKNICFSTYAYKVIKNELLVYIRDNLDHFKVLSFYDTIINNLQIKDTIVDDSDLQTDLVQKDLIKLLHKYIDELDETEKYVVSSILEGKLQKEIAEELNIKQPHVSIIYSRAINKLREKFKV